MGYPSIISMIYQQMLKNRGLVQRVDFSFKMSGYRESYEVVSFPNPSVRNTMTINIHPVEGFIGGEMHQDARVSHPIYTLGSHDPVEYIPGAFQPLGGFAWPEK